MKRFDNFVTILICELSGKYQGVHVCGFGASHFKNKLIYYNFYALNDASWGVYGVDMD